MNVRSSGRLYRPGGDVGGTTDTVQPSRSASRCSNQPPRRPRTEINPSGRLRRQAAGLTAVRHRLDATFSLHAGWRVAWFR